MTYLTLFSVLQLVNFCHVWYRATSRSDATMITLFLDFKKRDRIESNLQDIAVFTII